MSDYQKILNNICLYAGVIVSFLMALEIYFDLTQGISLLQPHAIRLFIVMVSYWIVFISRNYVAFNIRASLVIIIPVVGFILYPLYAPGVDASDLLIMSIVLLVLTVVPFTLFHPIKGKKYIWIFNLIATSSALFGAIFVLTEISQPHRDPDILNPLIDEPMIPVAFIGAFLAINWIIYQYQISNTYLVESLEKVNENLKANIETTKLQENEIRVQNNELQVLHQKLIQSNTDLESKVQKRTEKMEKVTKTLLKYSFMNSHLLRAPVTKLQSLLMLWDSLEEEKINEIASKSVEELDSAIKHILKTASTTDLESEGVDNRMIKKYSDGNF